MADSRIWGYIEGYYGRLFDWDAREGMLDHLAGLGGNAYLYAPKEDTLHRRDWRTPYPAPWRRRFASLVLKARRRGVEVVPGLAPGLSFDYLSPRDYAVLLRKLAAFRDLGCRSLALLMDDIPPSLPENCRGAFRTLGEAHALLLRKLRQDLGGKDGTRGRGAPEIWFCPTVYTDQFAAGPVASDPYLVDLAAGIPPDATVMWTGPRIISPRLGKAEIGDLVRLFRGRVLLWDNLYANDYCPGKIFLGPYRGRTSETWRLARGVLLNPTGLPETDRLYLDLLAAGSRGEPPLKAWESALAAREVPREFRAVAPFLDSPFFVPGEEDLSPRRMEAARKALKHLLWTWKGPLQREWYPHLFMLDADIRASGKGKETPDAEWVRKRYSPLIARLLLSGAGKGMAAGRPISAPEFL